MDQHPEHCPTCGRAFAGVQDYPRVQVLAFERLPLPEAIDRMSAPASERRHARRRIEPDTTGTPREEGINMTPAIAQACDTAEVRAYLSQLAGLVGQEVIPGRLLPPLRAHSSFRWAYPVAGTGIYLALEDTEPAAAGERVAEVQVYCDGPNLGSAGGPTLQPLGAVAQIRYRGLLASASSSGTGG
jgi:hypothetical protein